MQGLASGAAEAAGLDYEPEEFPARAINAMLKKAADTAGMTADEMVNVWHSKWLSDKWAKTRTPVFALKAFLSTEMITKLYREWEADEAGIREYERQLAAGIEPRDPSGRM